MSVAMAATKIQNLWKGAIARRQVKKQREEELAFIGMVNVYRKCIIQDLKNELSPNRYLYNENSRLYQLDSAFVDSTSSVPT